MSPTHTGTPPSTRDYTPPGEAALPWFIFVNRIFYGYFFHIFMIFFILEPL